MEQDQQLDIPPTPVETETQDAGIEPTKSVKNFWERLDEVFTQNLDLRRQMEDLVAQFPEEEKINTAEYRSFLFQPERVSLCSNDDIDLNTRVTLASPTGQGAPFSTTSGHTPAEKYSSFRIRMRRPLRNVKSVQLLSAVIPNAIQNIPDDQVFFFYYRLRKIGDGVTISAATANKGAWSGATAYAAGDIVTYNTNTFVALRLNIASLPAPPNLGDSWQQITLPADTTRPNYYDLNASNIQYVYLTPTYFWPPEIAAAGNQLYFNRTFQDYNDLLLSLNYCTTQLNGNNSIQNDVSFQYDDFLNKIILVPNPANIALGYYYLPCGYEDPNVTTFMISTSAVSFLGQGYTTARAFQFTPGYTLNSRLGFTWTGNFTNPFLIGNPWTSTQFMGSVYWYLRGKDPGFYPTGIPNPTPPPPFLPSLPAWQQNSITFNSYPDLVNTSCVRVYADFAFGSTQDSLGTTNTNDQPTQQGLLSIVPVNTTNLGVGFYQNNFSNPLTKIPQNLTEIGITMLTDQGLPFLLPNSATVLLELAITYH